MQLTSLNDITTKYRHIFLSPHFDDARLLLWWHTGCPAKQWLYVHL